ncbi:molybdenum cofactor guanylyltransferase [Psychrobacter sp. GP33]|uniref:molybdenum cofactor guanylyltransferase n=1 Tax=Psychrobacter sp. GP33 TaxID=2758709 RepID=UPI0015FD5A9F|nr:NTP transferase domain-containing protein [Psychrobacter sp. GP33]
MTDTLNSQDNANRLSEVAVLAGVVILAGGASKRMGSSKAQLILPTDETLLDYHVRQSIKLNVPIMIADNGRGFIVDGDLLGSNPKLPIFHIADCDSTNAYKVHDTGGALVAIESALQTLALSSAKSTDSSKLEAKSWLLVISCDSLIPASELWQHLQPFIAHVADKSVICLVDDAHLHPLLGLYRLDIEPELRAYIDQGERRVMRFIEPIKHTVPIPKMWQHLANFNTPDEFKRACTVLYQL